MNDFWFVTTSNQPRLRDPTKAQEIIDRYWFDFDCAVEIIKDSDGRYHLNIDGDGWPAAWLLPAGVSSEEYYPDYTTPGEEEFAQFLKEITPLLAETLIVQAIGTVNAQFPLSACEWLIEPNSAKVTKTQFTAPSENADVPSFLQASA